MAGRGSKDKLWNGWWLASSISSTNHTAAKMTSIFSCPFFSLFADLTYFLNRHFFLYLLSYKDTGSISTFCPACLIIVSVLWQKFKSFLCRSVPVRWQCRNQGSLFIQIIHTLGHHYHHYYLLFLYNCFPVPIFSAMTNSFYCSNFVYLVDINFVGIILNLNFTINGHYLLCVCVFLFFMVHVRHAYLSIFLWGRVFFFFLVQGISARYSRDIQ